MGTKCRAVARGVIASLTLTGLMLTGTASAHADQTLDTVLKRGKLVAGITYDSPPSGYLDAQGNVLGYCADVARYLAKRLGVGVEFVQITASTRVPLLRTGRIDAEIAITTPNKVRNEVVDFTYSYISDNGVLLVRDGQSTKVEDYYSPSKVIGSTQGNGFVPSWKIQHPDAQFKLYPEESSVIVAVKKGDVDAVLTNQFSAHRFAQSGGLAVTAPWTTSPDSIMVRQDESKWRNWLNWALQRMWVEGTLQKLYKKWYGIDVNFRMGDAGEIQSRVIEIGQTDDPWKELPPGFLDTLLGDQSYILQ
jgi:polar amino acid transport system substrate-binding protein